MAAQKIIDRSFLRLVLSRAWSEFVEHRLGEFMTGIVLALVTFGLLPGYGYFVGSEEAKAEIWPTLLILGSILIAAFLVFLFQLIRAPGLVYIDLVVSHNSLVDRYNSQEKSIDFLGEGEDVIAVLQVRLTNVRATQLNNLKKGYSQNPKYWFEEVVVWSLDVGESLNGIRSGLGSVFLEVPATPKELKGTDVQSLWDTYRTIAEDMKQKYLEMAGPEKNNSGN